MTVDLAALPWSGADSPATVNVTTRRKCRRHEWEWTEWAGDQSRVLEMVEWCKSCHRVRNPAVSRTNRNNRKRGNRTSLDLAVYLGGRNVEALKEPWDVEACGARIQSKRLAQRPSIAAIVGLIEYIDAGPALRALYWVGAGQRVASGRCYFLLEEWIGEHGWLAPETGAVVHVSRFAYVLELPVAAFREIRGAG